MLQVEIDRAAIHNLVNEVGATPKQVDQAVSSALRKMRRRTETAIKRQAAQQLRVPQKALGRRFVSDPVRQGDAVLKIWIGTYALSPSDIGSPRSYGVPGKSGGVRAGRRTWRGAFLASIYTPRDEVYIRLRSKHFSPDLYPTGKRVGGIRDIKAGGSSRYPVVRVMVPVDDVIERVVDNYHPEIRADFEKILGQELNYYTNVRGRK